MLFARPRPIDGRLPERGLAGSGRAVHNERGGQGRSIGQERVDGVELGLASHHRGRGRVHHRIMQCERPRAKPCDLQREGNPCGSPHFRLGGQGRSMAVWPPT
jgi:hypothetical protein